MSSDESGETLNMLDNIFTELILVNEKLENLIKILNENLPKENPNAFIFKGGPFIG